MSGVAANLLLIFTSFTSINILVLYRRLHILVMIKKGPENHGVASIIRHSMDECDSAEIGLLQ